MRAFPALGFDPCPGQPASVREIAGSLRRSADAMARSADLLRGQDHQWQGEAAAAFQQRVAVQAPEQLRRAEQSFLAAGSALTGWAELLVDQQRQAEMLESQAAELTRRVAELQRSTSSLAWEQSTADPFGLLTASPPDVLAWAPPDPRGVRLAQVRRELAVAHARLSQAGTELAQVRAAAARLRVATTEAAAGTARGLQAAKDLAPDGPGLLGQAVGAVGDALTAAWDWSVGLPDDMMGWLQEHHELLRSISDITGWLSSALSVLALVPFFTPLAVPLAIGLGAVSTATAYGAAVGEKGDWSQGFTPGVMLGAATTVAGAGAWRTAFKLKKAAEGGDMIRTGKTIIGEKTVPVGFIGVLRSSKGFSDAENGMRYVDWHAKAGSNLLTGFTVRDQVLDAQDQARHEPARAPSPVPPR